MFQSANDFEMFKKSLIQYVCSFLLMLLWEVAVDIKTSVAGGQMIPHPLVSTRRQIVVLDASVLLQ